MKTIVPATVALALACGAAQAEEVDALFARACDKCHVTNPGGFL